MGGWFSQYNDSYPDGIVRLNSDGSVDPDFDIYRGFSNQGIGFTLIYDIVPTNDGTNTLYVGGNYNEYGGRGYWTKYLVRLNIS